MALEQARGGSTVGLRGALASESEVAAKFLDIGKRLHYTMVAISKGHSLRPMGSLT